MKEGSGDVAARDCAALALRPAFGARPHRLHPRDAGRSVCHPRSSSTKQGNVVEMRFPHGEVVAFQPGSGVPRRIEANGPDGRAVLTLESYGPWPAGEEVPPL